MCHTHAAIETNSVTHSWRSVYSLVAFFFLLFGKMKTSNFHPANEKKKCLPADKFLFESISVVSTNALTNFRQRHSLHCFGFCCVCRRRRPYLLVVFNVRCSLLLLPYYTAYRLLTKRTILHIGPTEVGINIIKIRFLQFFGLFCF